MTLISVGWDYRKINIVVFGMMTFMSLYAKAIGTNYSSNLELQSHLVNGEESNEVIKLENAILDCHHKIISENRSGNFMKAILYRNYLYRIRNEILIYDSKSRKNPIKRMKYKDKLIALHKLQSALDEQNYAEFDKLLKEENITKFVNIKKMKRKSMKRSNVKMTALFSIMSGSLDDDLDGGMNQLKFNKWIFAFKANAIVLVSTPIIQLIYTGLTVKDYISSKQIWIDFMGYLVSIAMGIFSGINIGSDSIKKGYLPKLQERVKVIQEVLDIEKKIRVKPED